MSVDPVTSDFALLLTILAAHLERLAGAESPVLLLSLLILPVIIILNKSCELVDKVTLASWELIRSRVHIDDFKLLNGVVREIINLSGESLHVDVSAHSHAIIFLSSTIR